MDHFILIFFSPRKMHRSNRDFVFFSPEFSANTAPLRLTLNFLGLAGEAAKTTFTLENYDTSAPSANRLFRNCAGSISLGR